MERRVRWLAAALAVTVCGCGSKGGSAGSGMAQQDRAMQLATTVVLARKWTEILYGEFVLDRSPTCAQPPICDRSRERRSQEAQPDGSVGTRIIDCYGRDITVISLGSGRLRLVVRFPDEERTLRIEQAQLGMERTRYEWTYAEGGVVTDTLSYTREYDDRGTIFNSADDIERFYDATITLEGQSAATFMLRREHNRHDALTMELPDETRFTLEVPLRRNVQLATQEPVFGAVTKGSYTSGAQTLQFALTGTSSTARSWRQLEVQAVDGVSGFFLISPCFAGRGQFQLPSGDGRVEMSVSFDSEGKALVTRVSGDVTTAGPSAAAVAFLRHLWRENLALGLIR